MKKFFYEVRIIFRRQINVQNSFRGPPHFAKTRKGFKLFNVLVAAFFAITLKNR